MVAIFNLNYMAMMILYVVIVYLLTGILFAVLFLMKFIYTVDEASADSPWTFKLIIFPGCVVFWPVLLKKYLRARNTASNG